MKNINIKDFSQEEFICPEKENNVIYTWIWNEPVNTEIIDNQLEEFAKAGIGGIYILPMPENFRPHLMKTSMTPEYLTDDFFKCVKHALNKGKKLGMELWLYDEAGWPSGGAGGKTAQENPKARESVLCGRIVSLKEKEEYIPTEDTIASFEGKNRIERGFVAKRDTDICEYYTSNIDTTLLNHPNRVDSTNKGVIDAFINNTYERYKVALGDTFDDVTTIFTDEPSVIPGIIPENFFEIFKEKYGYDAEDYIYCITDASLAQTQEECMARIHYGRLLGDLFYENYCQNIGKWCEKNGKRFAGHLDLDHIPNGASIQCYFSHLRALSAFDIPGVDVIWHQIRVPEDGTPPVSEGAPFFPRLASSAAHQTDKNLALTESFAVYGDAVTPDEFRYVLNYQAIRGINVFNVMLMASGSSVMSSLVERPVFSPKKPGFYNMEHLNKYFARLSHLLRISQPQIETALYIPCADFWVNGKISPKAYESYIQKGTFLEERNIEFDIVDDYAILSAKVTENGLKIGKNTYRNIVVPECEFMPKEVREKISPYLTGDVGDAKPSQVRTMKRKLPSGMLYFAFNEGKDSVRALLDIPCDAPLYRLNIAQGGIYKVSKGETCLSSGDMAVFYSTGEELVTVCEEVEYTEVLTDFEIVDTKQFVISRDGISMGPAVHTNAERKDFSGEVTYKAKYRLPDIPSDQDRYKIILEDTRSSARISIDGKQVATVGITPMETVISGRDLMCQGILEITVANTAGNEIVAKNGIITAHPPEIVGPYHEKSIEFEKFAQNLKLGKVKLVKLKRE